ncbi:MAG: PAS domain S-box protein [Promethearchaeota archaeon]
MSKFNNELKESETKYLNLINNILDILVELNLDLTITYINSQVYDLLGYSSEELIGKNFIDHIHPNEMTKINEIINYAIKKNKQISIELNVKHKKGQYIQFLGKGQLFNDNTHVKIVLLLRPVIGLKENQQLLMESYKKYRKIIENIEDGYFEVDLRGNYTYVNDYTCRYLGIPKKELLGKNYTTLVDKDTIEEIYKIFNNVYENDLPKGTFESQVLRSDGSLRTFEGSFYLRYDSSGRKVGFYGFTRDITEKKEAEKKLKQSEKKFREAYNRAELYKDLFYHDINNILTNIGISIELSENYLNDPERETDIKEIYDLLKKQFVRGKKLVTNVQKLSSLDAAEKSLKSIDAIKVLKDAINIIRTNKRIRDIDISIDSFKDEIFIQANDLLMDIFENLLINALNYNDKSKVEILIRISKKLEKSISFIKFEFIDNGIGISDEKKRGIFQERFFKEKGSKGMGFGLTLVKKILESYGGKIWVEDRVKGDYTQGANFIFLIREIASNLELN